MENLDLMSKFSVEYWASIDYFFFFFSCVFISVATCMRYFFLICWSYLMCRRAHIYVLVS